MKKLLYTIVILSLFGAQFFVRQTQAQEKPFTIEQILRALATANQKPGPQKAVLLEKIRTDVKTRGVDFPLTKANEKRLRDAGAGNELIIAVRQNSPAKSVTNEKEFKNSLGMEFILIPGGSVKAINRQQDVLYTLTVEKSFWMTKTEVTQGQWKAVMKNNPSSHQSCGDNCPVEDVSWDEVQEFIQKLNLRATGTYRLPTEIEFEYAMRGGSSDTQFWGNDANLAGEYAWYAQNSGSKTHEVGRKKPNNFGLYDIAGNVMEWCQEADSGDGTKRRVRGGSATSDTLRSYEYYRFPQSEGGGLLGFRLVYEGK